jgi:hypothetical protein
MMLLEEQLLERHKRIIQFKVQLNGSVARKKRKTQQLAGEV